MIKCSSLIARLPTTLRWFCLSRQYGESRRTDYWSSIPPSRSNEYPKCEVHIFPFSCLHLRLDAQGPMMTSYRFEVPDDQVLTPVWGFWGLIRVLERTLMHLCTTWNSSQKYGRFVAFRLLRPGRTATRGIRIGLLECLPCSCSWANSSFSLRRILSSQRPRSIHECGTTDESHSNVDYLWLCACSSLPWKLWKWWDIYLELDALENTVNLTAHEVQASMSTRLPSFS
jgi:hypothetical protein